MDGLSLYAITHELQSLLGGRIEKIQQPERDTLLLSVHAGGETHRLLLCANPQNGRAHLTAAAFANPLDAPSFCMLLRRRIGGGRITDITQPNLDRVLILSIQARDELGDARIFRIIVELMGKHSNIIFLDDQDIVLECARHISPAMSTVRILQPGVRYAPPPAQEKQDPLLASEEAFRTAISGRGSVHKLLYTAFFGLSPDCARQLVARWAGEGEVLAEQFKESDRTSLARYLAGMYGMFRQGVFQPTLVLGDSGTPVAFYPFAIGVPAECQRSMGSMGALLDTYYAERDVAERIRQRGGALQKLLQTQLERSMRKLAVYEQALHASEDLERLRLYGELVTANAHQLQRGMAQGTVLNYYEDPPAECTVPLDERLSPQENAQRYFKRYQKGKAAKALAAEQRRETLLDITYLEGQLDNLQKCTDEQELREIREELAQQGYVRREQGAKKAAKPKPSKPLKLLSSDGYEIYIGKNNQQNDRLTLQFAKPEDWWLHTKDIPGSHVIVRMEGKPQGELPEATLHEAALLAAYFSKARASASVPVDYTQKRYVKKPGGARPGMVIYTNNRTIYITPEEAAINRLLGYSM